MNRFTIPKLEQRVAEVRERVVTDRQPLQHLQVAEGDPTKESVWRDLADGDRWGGHEGVTWFRARFVVPAQWSGRRLRVHVKASPGHAEGLLYVDGNPTQGLDWAHPDALLTETAKARREYSLTLAVTTGYLTPRGREFSQNTLVAAEVWAMDRDAEDFAFNAHVALEAAKTLPDSSPDRHTIINTLDEAFGLVDFCAPLADMFYESLRRANEVLKAKVYDALHAADRPSILFAGHSHIDVAWLWPLEETRRKCGRTFATVLSLMDQYPDYHFLQSQPQLYKYTKEDFPQVYERLCRRVAEGRWEATGGMWVEADTNVPSGESLVRQVLFGKRFFRQEFGVDNTLLWLPDVFGYTAALPQIIAKSGMEYFMTTKVSWNQWNKIPYDTFWWEGLDGSRVLTHFITAPVPAGVLGTIATYNGNVELPQVQGTWADYKQKSINDTVLYAFGHGDGGGGPTREMLETLSRLKDFPGVPRCRQGKAEQFFADLAARLKASGAEVPVWKGELYFELHRGTYTTQARTKKNNRKSEVLYHDAELFSAWASLLGHPYPQQALNTGWETILLNQFHDVLPGSSIREVYEESERQFVDVQRAGLEARDSALRALASQVDLPEDRALVVFNSLSWNRTDLATAMLDVEGDFELLDEEGQPVAYQRVSEEEIVFIATVPACGYATYRLRAGRASECVSRLDATTEALENEFYRVALTPEGTISSLFDKQNQREVLAAGAMANAFQRFEDKPLAHDAWDIDLFYRQKMWTDGVTEDLRVIEAGPVRAGVEFKRRFSRSLITQRLFVYQGLPRIDFATEVDWHEKHVLLKVAFPVDVHSSRATYDIQFGNLERPTHWNTSWDWARFEVCAQKWADLSEGDYGVSLINDCKYGYDVKENLLRLTLLRSPESPDPKADEGLQEFTYALYPHAGDWRSGTVRRAYELNYPLVAVLESPHPGALPPSASFVTADCDNVIVETVKKAEDDESLILRIYECYNQRGEVTLTFSRNLAEACDCDLMEENRTPPACESNTFRTFVKPYEIKTFALKFAP